MGAQGKVAIITGGDSGIGRAVARLFSLEGASVAITYVPDVEEKDADDTLDIIKKNKVADAKDPIKIGVDIGFAENCKKVQIPITHQQICNTNNYNFPSNHRFWA